MGVVEEGVRIAPPRLAATVMMVRDAPFEVLMVKRNSRPPFASALVFPGGVVEPEDYSEQWLAHLDAGESLEVEERALRIAAHRETWEEAGILPGADCGQMTRRSATDASFLEIVKHHGLRLVLDDLVLFAHWITPEAAPKRFDTYFYICRAPASGTGQCDGGETVELEWIQPQEALARGDRSILLPTRTNLQLLAESTNSLAAMSAARNRIVLPIMPRNVPLP